MSNQKLITMDKEQILKLFGVNIGGVAENTIQKRILKYLCIRDMKKAGLNNRQIEIKLGLGKGTVYLYKKNGIAGNKYFEIIERAYLKRDRELFFEFMDMYENEKKNKNKEYFLRYSERKADKKPAKLLSMDKVLDILEPYRKTNDFNILKLWNTRLDKYTSEHWTMLRSINEDYFDKHKLN